MPKQRKKNPELEKMVLQKKRNLSDMKKGAQLYSMGLHTFSATGQGCRCSIQS